MGRLDHKEALLQFPMQPQIILNGLAAVDGEAAEAQAWAGAARDSQDLEEARLKSPLPVKPQRVQEIDRSIFLNDYLVNIKNTAMYIACGLTTLQSAANGSQTYTGVRTGQNSYNSTISDTEGDLR